MKKQKEEIPESRDMSRHHIKRKNNQTHCEFHSKRSNDLNY